MSERYNRWHTYGDVKFYLSEPQCSAEEARYLLLKVIEQAVRDYTTMYNPKTPSERVLWESAQDFIYDDEYRVMWGDLELNLEEMLDILDIDIHWFREQTTKKFEGRLKDDSKEKGKSKR